MAPKLPLAQNSLGKIAVPIPLLVSVSLPPKTWTFDLKPEFMSPHARVIDGTTQSQRNNAMETKYFTLFLRPFENDGQIYPKEN